jgi:predicted metallopeptidase
MNYKLAPEIKRQVRVLIKELKFTHIKPNQIWCIRSSDAKTRAYARIWGMSRLFHEVAGLPPTYIIEIINQHFEKLSPREKTKTLIHELMHIPKTFSGALLSHRGPHHQINDREVERILRNLK